MFVLARRPRPAGVLPAFTPFSAAVATSAAIAPALGWQAGLFLAWE